MNITQLQSSFTNEKNQSIFLAFFDKQIVTLIIIWLRI